MKWNMDRSTKELKEIDFANKAYEEYLKDKS